MLQTILLDLATLATAGEPPTEARLFRAGKNATKKGVFLFDEKAAESVRRAADDWGVRLAFDYAHSMLGASRASDPAEAGKAAGTFRLEARNGELWAVDCEWTPRAAQKIRDKEFRYLSPAFQHDPDGRVLEIVNCALTNIPATKNIDPLTLEASAVAEDTGVTRMKGLLARLGLAADASEERALEVLAGHEAVLAELTQVTGKPPREALGLVRLGLDAIKRCEALSTEVATLRKSESDRLIADAIKAGKLAPAQKTWAEGYGAENPAGLRAYLEAAPALVKMADSEPGAASVSAAVQLSDDDRLVCKLMGIPETDFLKAKSANGQA